MAKNPLYKFQPRPDAPEQFDQQASFVNDRKPGIMCCISGNGAGKSFSCSYKVAKFLLDTPPPEPNTPFWVLSQSMDLVTDSCWSQNLSHFIGHDQIHDVVWFRQAKNQPKSIVLKPHKNGNNYILELKSYDMDRKALQGANIIGFWADEQCPQPILREVLARTRKWNYPGSKLYTLTPLTPDPDPESLQYIFEHQDEYPTWSFYRQNTRLNKTLDPNYVKLIEENEVSALVETRLTGAFANFQGAVYPQFDTKKHVIKPIDINRNWLHIRGLDLGFSHATCCLWCAVDQITKTYYIYKEYLKTKTSVEDHVREINEGWNSLSVRGHTYADPAAAATLHEFRLRGLNTVPANKDILAGIANVQTLLREPVKLFIFDTCPTLISQIRNYVWDKDKYDRPTKVNDDAVDALRYLVRSHQLGLENFKVETVKRPEKERKFRI